MTTEQTSIHYGPNKLALPTLDRIAQVIEPRRLAKPQPVEKLLRQALENPAGSPRLRELARPSDKVTIIMSDPARRFCKAEMFDAALAELHAAGVPDANIRLLIASGLHSHTDNDQVGLDPVLLERHGCAWNEPERKDMLALIGLTRDKPDWPAYLKYLRRIARIQWRDPADNVRKFASELLARDEEALRFRRAFGLPARLGVVLGASLRTPIQINRMAKESDLLVCLGLVKPHYFAGFGGGAKSILPGVASRLTVGANHAMKTHPRAMLGVLRGNVARQDMEDAARLYKGKAFILNVCQDCEGRSLAAAAGDLVQAHRRLIPWLRKVGQVKVGRRTPIVIAGQGLPTAHSVYQMTKTVAPAAKCITPGGTMIIAGPCDQALGATSQKCEAIFRIGLIKYMPDDVEILLVSQMRDRHLVRNMFFKLMDSMEQALERAWERNGREAEITVLPQAGPMIPVAPEEDDSDWDDEWVPKD